MKKYIGLIGLGIILSTQSVATTWTAANCTNRAGSIIEAADGKLFCVSNVDVNWYSANVWCEKHGGKLSSYQNACNLAAPYVAAKCPNLQGRVAGGDYYFADVSSGIKPYHYNQGFSNNLYTGPFNNRHRALCE